jgi:DHA1 family 2-module integral membrane pump EmrD-like MFS transporter
MILNVISTTTMKHDTFKILTVLTLTAMVSRFAENSLLPTLPAMADFFGVTARHMKLAVSVYLIGLCLSQLIYGPLSDHLGRKLITLVGLGVCILGSFIAALAIHLPLFLWGHFIQGLGIGAIAGLFRAILRDCYVDKQLAKVDSYLNITMVFMAPLAMMSGAYLGNHVGWQSNFIAVFSLAMLVVCWLYYAMPETLPLERRARRSLKTVLCLYGDLLKTPNFMRYTLLTAFIYGGFISYLTVTPFLYQHVYLISSQAFSYLSLPIAVGFLLGAAVNAYFVHYVGVQSLLILSMYLLLFAAATMLCLGLFGLANVWVVLIPMMLYVMATSMVLANAFTLAFAELATMAGLASALYTSIQMLIAGLWSSLAALLPGQTQIPLALILLISTLMALGLMQGRIRKSATILPTI